MPTATNYSNQTLVFPVCSEALYSTQDGRLPPNQPKAIIFDLGDVLFTWSFPSADLCGISFQTFKLIRRSGAWCEYENGKLSKEETYRQVSVEFELSIADLEAVLRAAIESLTVCEEILTEIREFKASGFKVYAMSNITAPGWEILKATLRDEDWALFDQVFTSSQAGRRKPNLGFYHHVLSRIDEDPSEIIFVDDKLENVLSARSFGMYGIVFDNATNVIRQLRNLLRGPVRRANQYLHENAKRLSSYTSTGVALEENFAQLVILEATDDPTLVSYIRYKKEWNYFQGNGQLTTVNFPPDLDTTSLAFTILFDISDSIKHEVMDEILAERTADGITQVYFGKNRPRIDPVTCIITLDLFYRYGRGHQLGETLEETLRQAILERFGAPGDAMALSMRIIAANYVGIVDSIDLPALFSLQQDDGRFTGYFYRYPSTGVLIGNDGVATALAIQAIKLVQSSEGT